MSFIWCASCGSDVVDVDGFCMLGHRLGVKEFASFPAEEPIPAPVLAAHRSFAARPATAPAPPPRAVTIPASVPLHVPPPPPPPAPRPAGASADNRQVWRDLENLDAEVLDDPIVAFAPPPRMDWGPDEPLPLPRGLRSLLRKSGAQRRLESLAG